MTDEQIIKALECCHSELGNMCSICPLFDLDNDYCEDELHKNTLNLIDRQKAEIEELKDIIAKVPTNAYDLQVEASEKLENQIKSEAIKEFAERLKGYPIVEEVRDIDNLVKEMTEVKE